jgi:hypothetical protein
MLTSMSPKPRSKPGGAPTPSQPGHTIDGIPWGQVELEPEVADWLQNVDDQRWAQAFRQAAEPPQEPHPR